MKAEIQRSNLTILTLLCTLGKAFHVNLLYLVALCFYRNALKQQHWQLRSGSEHNNVPTKSKKYFLVTRE